MALDPVRWQDTWVWEDTSKTLWFAQLNDKHLSALKMDGSTLHIDLPVTAITGFAIDDSDNLLVVDSGLVRCFKPGGASVIESGSLGSIFAGKQVGRGFTVDRSSSMFDQRFHTSVGWRWDAIWNATCPSDINGDGEVSGADLTFLLGSWGDLALILATWGPCQ